MSMKIEPVTSTENFACVFGFALSIIFRGGSANMHSSPVILRAAFQNILHHLFHDHGKFSDQNWNQEQPQSPYHCRLVQGQRAYRFAACLKFTPFSYGRI
jgi:hypothetical protein